MNWIQYFQKSMKNILLVLILFQFIGSNCNALPRNIRNSLRNRSSSFSSTSQFFGHRRQTSTPTPTQCAKDTNRCPYISGVLTNSTNLPDISLAPWHYWRDGSPIFGKLKPCCSCYNCVDPRNRTSRLLGYHSQLLYLDESKTIPVGCVCVRAIRT